MLLLLQKKKQKSQINAVFSVVAVFAGNTFKLDQQQPRSAGPRVEIDWLVLDSGRDEVAGFPGRGELDGTSRKSGRRRGLDVGSRVDHRVESRQTTQQVPERKGRSLVHMNVCTTARLAMGCAGRLARGRTEQDRTGQKAGDGSTAAVVAAVVQLLFGPPVGLCLCCSNCCWSRRWI